MSKHKFGFCLIFVLVVGLCANLLASDKNVSFQHELKWLKDFPLFQKEARTPFPASGGSTSLTTLSLCFDFVQHPEFIEGSKGGIFEPTDLWTSQRTQNFTKVVNETGAISGHVYQASRGVPIEGVKITADQLIVCPAYSASDYSDENGYYLINGLPPGNYMVSTVNDSDFVNMNWDNKPIWETPDTVEVFADDTTEDINFSLRVGGKITGTVTLSGVPPVMATVYAIDTTSRESYYGSADYLTGSYVIKRLPTGTYKVKTSNYLGYIDVYYDDKSSWADADPITVIEGVTPPITDFTLSLGGSIEGNISSPGKGPLENIWVWGYYASDPGEWSSFGATDEYGDYTLMGLRSGYWKIFAYGDTTYAFEWYNDKDTWAEADSVEVTAPDTVSDIDFSLEDGGSISGHVYDLEGLPLSGCDVMAYESSFFQWGFTAKWDTTIANGSYQITGLRTGDYYVMAATECYWMWYDNHTNPEDADSVHVIMPSDHSGIDFNLPTAVEDEDEIAQRPAEFELHQNYPNPFNPGTRIEYTLKKAGHVSLHIYNVLGEKVKTLLDQDQPVGFYRINWDGKNDKGQSVSSGLYLYKLQVNGFSQAKRMLLLK